MKDIQVILQEATKGMGFVPSSLIAMAEKPNILGSFSLLYANIKGFSSTETSAWTGFKIMIKNLIWTLRAKRNHHEEVPAALKDMIAHVASNAAGCRYCQAHTAHTAHRNGVEVEKIQKVWEFETCPLFTEQERAALRFAMAAGSVPNLVTPEHHAVLDRYFSKPQKVEIVATVAIFGFLNSWNDSMATELEDEPLAFAEKHLSHAWNRGKH